MNAGRMYREKLGPAIVAAVGVWIGWTLLAADPAQAALLAHYELNETSGTTASDSTVNGNDGTLQNFDFDTDDGWRPGLVGNAILQDGKNMNDPGPAGQNIRLPDNLSTASSGTVAMHMKHPDVSQVGVYSAMDILYSFTNTNSGSVNRVGLSNDGTGAVVQATVYDGTNYATVTGSTVIQSDTWYHVAITSDGSSLKWYVNGAEETVSSSTGGLGESMWWDDVAGTVQMHLGSLVRHVNESNWLGTYDNVRIYDTALSQQEIAALVPPVPEPATCVLLGIGSLGLLTFLRRKDR